MICPGCGGFTSFRYKRCPECGTKLPQPEETQKVPLPQPAPQPAGI